MKALNKNSRSVKLWHIIRINTRCKYKKRAQNTFQFDYLVNCSKDVNKRFIKLAFRIMISSNFKNQ